MYNRCALALWQALGLRNPGQRKDSDDDDIEEDLAPKSGIAVHHDFVPPPPLSVIGVANVETVEVIPEDVPGDEEKPSEQQEWEEENLLIIKWKDLPAEVDEWQRRQLAELGPKITPVCHNDMKNIARWLSGSTPDAERQVKMKKTLGSYHWECLAYFCSIVLALPEDRLPTIPTLTKKQVRKKEMGDALVEWRVNQVVENGFIWPNFTTRSRDRVADDLSVLPEPQFSALDSAQRTQRLEELVHKMNYLTAVGIGRIHNKLRKPMQGSAALWKWLKRKEITIEALKYVCVDLNRLPPDPKCEKAALIDNLVSWRLAQPLKATPWPRIESLAVLQRIHQAITEVIVPTWTDKPPQNVGLPAAGTLKSDNWRVLFEVYVPLALLTLWQEESPVSASDALEMEGALKTAMHFTCASLHMTRHHPTFQDRKRFLESWKLHIQGLKDNFAGCSVPSHHLGWHIFDFTDEFGAVHNFWCFFGERFLGKLRDIPINHKSGEFEGTLLHSYYKGCGFRQWLLLHERPGIMRKCMDLVSRAYGYGPPDDEESNGASELPVDKIPSDILELFPLRPVRSFRKYIIGGVRYTIMNYSESDSSICFNSTTHGKWLAGRIEYIFEDTYQAIKLVVRQCKNPRGCGSDPFSAFWAEGFEAKLVSTEFAEKPEVVALPQLLGHTARWELSSDEAVVLRRSKE